MIYRNKADFKAFYDNNIATDFLSRKVYEDKKLVSESLHRMDAIYIPALYGVQRFGYGNEREVLLSVIDFGVYAGLTYISNKALEGMFSDFQNGRTV